MKARYGGSQCLLIVAFATERKRPNSYRYILDELASCHVASAEAICSFYYFYYEEN